MNKIFNAIVATTLITGTACVASTPKDISVKEETAVPVEVEELKTWTCPECSPNERYVLKQLQELTRISDRNALATIMGNIRSESNFIPDICEGGARVKYDECHVGGYGIIQWSSINRYRNLGKFCQKFNCDPSSLEGQTRYMINESTFQRYLPMFEGSGQTISQYMISAYKWLGWGIKGYREEYAYDYTKKLVLT